MYLLDTNIIGELRKLENGKADPNVVKWFQSVDLQETYISVITLFETKLGILQIKHRDPQQAQRLEYWFENRLLPNFEHRILPLDVKSILSCAEMHVPNKKQLNDSYLAATAKTHRLKMVTRNVKDFENCGVEIINPFSA